MSDHDDHVISYEEAVRRHRALEARRREGVHHEVKISDAMSRLLEEGAGQQDDGPAPSHLRGIVERDFSDDGPACGLADRPGSAPRS